MSAAADRANRYDIVIVGGGVVGASLACALAHHEHAAQLQVALVEPGPAPTLYRGEQFDPRVVALTRQSQQFLDSLGAWSAIQAQRVCPYTRMFVWDGEGTASIEFNSREFREENLGHIVENAVVLCALLDRLAACSRVSLLRGRKVEQVQEGLPATGDRLTLVLDDGERLESSLVLAADGGNSKIRQLLGMETREWDYDQDAIVTTVRSENSHNFTAWQRFMHTGPLAFLPLQGGAGDSYFSSIVWSLDRNRVPALMAMDDASFAEALGAAFEHKLGKITDVAKRFSFPLRQCHASDYVRPGFALVGDAAHTIHPLAGQGVNLGLLDAEALAGEIERALQRGIPLSDYSLLRRYQRRRKGANLGMMALMEGFKRLFGSRDPGLHLARNMGVRQVNNLPALKKVLARRAMGLGR
ncbi:MAG: UbiH/UbiF/VisC/COQ6 family ubiquinone biosynthesis hydroxylase [Cellvibrionaceae bacterium]